ncbi:MAG: hypothetical protein KQA41_01200 [Candidatus Aenigmarchaeota archaeon]|nr:hypothetical protein [Candidatus Aenigmarchaeota archaeon]MBU5688828.1 hypothetical protein [Candidatus Aenigmarchaeota archaeon]
MPIVGFYLKNLNAFRKNQPKDRIDINTTVNILNIEKTSIGIKNKESALDVSFEFFTKYEPNVGEIRLEGNVMYIGNKVNDALKLWKKEKRVLPEVDVEIKNFLFRKCMTIEINLAENMSLPPPIMFPTVMIKRGEEQKDTRYIG